MAAGAYPDDEFRTAPDPALFDDLALRLARADSRMPVLMYLDLSSIRTDSRLGMRGNRIRDSKGTRDGGFTLGMGREQRVPSIGI